MNDSYYLIAIALFSQNGQRKMPLNGKSLSKLIVSGDDPGEIARDIALELFVRVWMRSDDGPLKRESADKGFLILRLSFEDMQNKLPLFKSEWIRDGDTKKFISNLIKIKALAWKIDWNRYDGPHFVPIDIY